MILNFNSFEQLRKDGWTANFSIGGYKKYLSSSKLNNIVLGVIGIKNSGKSFILRRILEKTNYKPKDGFLVDTYGISCIFPESERLPLIILDTQGIDKVLLKSSYTENNDIKPKNDEIKSIIRDQKVCELLLSDYIIRESDLLIAVVEQLSFAEQEMLRTLIEKLKKKEIDSFQYGILIVIHNLMNIEKSNDIEKYINETLFKSLTFSLEKLFVKGYENLDNKLYIYLQKMEDYKRFYIFHLVIGNDYSQEIRKQYNEPAFRYIRDFIDFRFLKEFNVLESFKRFIIDNSKKFMSNNWLTDDSLEIGEKQIKKVYVDKNREKPTEERIIMPIRIKDNISQGDFNLKPFYFGTNEIFYHSNSIEHIFSIQILKSKDNSLDKNEIKIKQIEKQLIEKKNKNIYLNKRIIELEKIINDKNTIINKKEKEIKEFNEKIKQIIFKNKDYYKKIITLNEQLDELKLRFPFELNKNEKLMVITFITEDQNINYSLICKNTEKFIRIKNAFYKEYPEYFDSHNIFIINGNIINKNKSLEENKIKDNDKIYLRKKDEDR